jgi:hypothetical protein
MPATPPFPSVIAVRIVKFFESLEGSGDFEDAM